MYAVPVQTNAHQDSLNTTSKRLRIGGGLLSVFGIIQLGIGVTGGNIQYVISGIISGILGITGFYGGSSSNLKSTKYFYIGLIFLIAFNCIYSFAGIGVIYSASCNDLAKAAGQAVNGTTAKPDFNCSGTRGSLTISTIVWGILIPISCCGSCANCAKKHARSLISLQVPGSGPLPPGYNPYAPQMMQMGTGGGPAGMILHNGTVMYNGYPVSMNPGQGGYPAMYSATVNMQAPPPIVVGQPIGDPSIAIPLGSLHQGTVVQMPQQYYQPQQHQQQQQPQYSWEQPQLQAAPLQRQPEPQYSWEQPQPQPQSQQQQPPHPSSQ